MRVTETISVTFLTDRKPENNDQIHAMRIIEPTIFRTREANVSVSVWKIQKLSRGPFF